MARSGEIRSIRFVVEGPVVGKGRPRFTRSGRVYTPAKTKEYETLISERAALAMSAAGLEPARGPVTMRITALFDIPKSWPQWKKDLAAAGRIGPAKPDIDNVAKAALDGLNGVAYIDDVQVNELTVHKRYGSAALIVTVEWKEETNDETGADSRAGGDCVSVMDHAR